MSRTTERIPTRKPLPSQYYPEEDTELTFKLKSRGFTNEQIARALVYEFPDNHGQGRLTSSRVHNARRKVKNILRDPEAWNPYVDAGRIHAAFMCDVIAYDSLSHYERRDLFEQLYEWWKTNKPHPKFPGNGSDWQRDWCRAVDENPNLLSARIAKHQNVKEKRLPQKFVDGRPITDELMRTIALEYRDTDITQRALAKKYGMSHASVGSIVNCYEL